MPAAARLSETLRCESRRAELAERVALIELNVSALALRTALSKERERPFDLLFCCVIRIAYSLYFRYAFFNDTDAK